MRSINTVLFDLDDTLHDDTTAYRSAARSVSDTIARERGIDAQTLTDAYDASAQKYWAALTTAHLGVAISVERERMWYEGLLQVGIDDRALAHRAADEYVAARAGALELFPGTIELLERLRERGCKLGLVTNGFAATHHDKIDRLGLRERMDAFFLADEVGMVKPDPELFLHACRALGSTPERTAMVGDRYDRDVRGAHDVGMFTVLIDIHRKPIPAEGPRPDAIVATIADVLAVLPPAPVAG
ncbi:MAG: putative hydrolase [Candidatus Eremiobacteraeota bacterium]|jgi:putative hydrolase of the HAD superfamily|nr:putative hydrolase [Candidatus Eremiobacteraeota bacterium]